MTRKILHRVQKDKVRLHNDGIFKPKLTLIPAPNAYLSLQWSKDQNAHRGTSMSSHRSHIEKSTSPKTTTIMTSSSSSPTTSSLSAGHDPTPAHNANQHYGRQNRALAQYYAHSQPPLGWEGLPTKITDHIRKCHRHELSWQLERVENAVQQASPRRQGTPEHLQQQDSAFVAVGGDAPRAQGAEIDQRLDWLGLGSWAASD